MSDFPQYMLNLAEALLQVRPKPPTVIGFSPVSEAYAQWRKDVRAVTDMLCENTEEVCVCTFQWMQPDARPKFNAPWTAQVKETCASRVRAY